MKNAKTTARIILIVMMVITVVTVESTAGTYLFLTSYLETRKSVICNSADPDQTPHYVGSDQGYIVC